MKIIDLNNWKRTAHFNFFKNMDYPQYLICKNIDVTNFLSQLRKEKVSFYYGMIFAATYTLNQIEEFKYRIKDGQVVLYDEIHPSFTDMQKNSELFKMVASNMEDNIFDFIENTKRKSENQKEYFVIEEIQGREDLVYITCIPWITFTGLSHTITLNNKDTIPRLAWGKYFEENEKVLMPFSIQAHHSFIDGLHMGKYFDILQEYLNSFDKEKLKK